MAVKSYDLSSLRVLVLEQHQLMRRVLADILKEFGVSKVDTVDTDVLAWDMFNTNHYDLLLVDWAPALNGKAFVRKIRHESHDRNRFVPVIMVTAFAEPEQIFAARDAGMHEYLRKPVSAKLLYSRIVSLIENDRIFIRTKDFFGPNRRRRNLEVKNDRRETFQITFPDRRNQDQERPVRRERRNDRVGTVTDETDPRRRGHSGVGMIAPTPRCRSVP